LKKAAAALFLVVMFWTIAVGFFLRHASESVERNVHEIALVQARAFFQQVLDVRSWNASHGGVYVEVTDDTQPNPYLDVPERDIETRDGRKMTLINPAYMTRKIAERGLKEHGVGIHITSLKPIRPANAPLEWEAAALRSFEEGAEEYAGFSADDGGTVFRYMAPLSVEESCLRCHAKQGYEAGDIRGGISVSFPEDALIHAKASRRRENVLSALVIWLVGLGIIAVSTAFILQKQKLVGELQEMSFEDPLTGLRNRRGFMTLCAQEMEIAKRWGKSALLLFMDVDYLKEINDTHGHAEGDEALRIVARVIRSAFRQADVTARLGGDEFAVFCLDSSLLTASSVKKHLGEKLEWENRSGGRDYRLSISVGCAEYRPEEGIDIESLMKEADEDMYTQKQARGAATAAS
jgi:diguanylate cyclase (GGDEF)-like protein